MGNLLNRLAILILILVPWSAIGQSAEGFIYGTVTLEDGQTRTGQLRWDDEEALWEDMFNAYKASPPIVENVDAEQAQDISRNSESFDFGFMNLWEDRSPDLKYAFKIRFGDMARLEVTGEDKAEVTLRNGTTIKLKDGANSDLDQKIVLYDNGSGQVEISWNNIRTIDFKPAPLSNKSAIGKPLYGRLLTTDGIFEGYITWDLEECVSLDLLGGKDNGLDVEIEFDRVTQIQAEADGSLVTLTNGKQVFLNKHPDVSATNRGIQVKTRDQGVIQLEWEYFISIEFLKPPYPSASYVSFLTPQAIFGEVVTANGSTSGRIVYDLDETWNIELVDGLNAGFRYYLPFYLIQEIQPQNYQFSMIKLKTGQQILLGKHGDVSNDNNGILIFPQAGQPKYVPWVNVKQVNIDLQPY